MSCTERTATGKHIIGIYKINKERKNKSNLKQVSVARNTKVPYRPV